MAGGEGVPSGVSATGGISEAVEEGVGVGMLAYSAFVTKEVLSDAPV